ncbi:N-6 DNA methylase [Muricauda sp. 81s02]|uniref:N-6 DNA methylase n=1 Tax=Flagellimonas okinawensis TaxID=3031324 RepID=A0ABT5XK28_9FLAO|nr:N-6 DNA methylase [[Muricauda] okinawensis]MDF0706248.1 N-6 DNA methylase [[Muricauda] okinawensis]
MVVLVLTGPYRTRGTKDKFSCVASLDEVAKNDYNLNISRYVDTFEEEEPVDLDQVAADLQSLQKDLSETNAMIADFCQQLNLKTPF